MKKHLILLASALIIPLFSLAQLQAVSRHELSVFGMLGLTSLKHDKNKGNLGGGGGVAYAYLRNDRWSFVGGVEYASFSSSYSSDNFVRQDKQQYSYNGAVEEMYLISSYVGYKEKLTARYLHVPLMVRFQRPIRYDSKTKLYIAAGVKLGAALKSGYEITAKNLTLSGYFPKTDQTFIDMPNHGFDSNNYAISNDLSLGFNAALGAEIGLRHLINKRVALYTGIYADYGLLNVASSASDNEATQPTLQPNNSFQADKISLQAVGVKVQLSFDLTKQPCNC